MKILLYGNKTFVQTYNPYCIMVMEREKGSKNIVRRFYEASKKMPLADKLIYNSLSRRTPQL